MQKEATIKTDEIIAPHLRLAHSLRGEGDYDGARAAVFTEMDSLASDDVRGRLACVIELSKVERAAGKCDLALDLLRQSADLAEGCGSNELRAKYRHALAYTLQLLGDLDLALLEYAAASDHWTQAGNLYDAGCTENNVALIQLSLGRFEDARECIARARVYFDGMVVKLAEVNETEAQLMLAEGKSLEALALVNESVSVFISHGERKLLLDALPTLIKAAVDYKVENR